MDLRACFGRTRPIQNISATKKPEVAEKCANTENLLQGTYGIPAELYWSGIFLLEFKGFSHFSLQFTLFYDLLLHDQTPNCLYHKLNTLKLDFDVS